MIFKHRDGELRLYDGSSQSTGPAYMQILFTNADLTFPIERPRGEEMLNLDRGNVDTNSSYSLGSDEAIMEPLAFSFSARLDDTVNTTYLKSWMSGSSGTVINGHTLRTSKGLSSVTNGAGTAVSTPVFADTKKIAYNAEVLWDGAVDFGYKHSEIWFAPDQQTVSESDDSVTLNLNGLIYGEISELAAFTTGATIQASWGE